MSKRIRNWDTAPYAVKLRELASRAVYEGIAGRTKLVTLVYKIMEYIGKVQAIQPDRCEMGRLVDYVKSESDRDIESLIVNSVSNDSLGLLTDLLLNPRPEEPMGKIIDILSQSDNAERAATAYLSLDYPTAGDNPSSTRVEYWRMMGLSRPALTLVPGESEDSMSSPLYLLRRLTSVDDQDSAILAAAVTALHCDELQISRESLRELIDLPTTLIAECLDSGSHPTLPGIQSSDEASVIKLFKAVLANNSRGLETFVNSYMSEVLARLSRYHTLDPLSDIDVRIAETTTILLTSYPSYLASNYYVSLYIHRALTAINGLLQRIYGCNVVSVRDGLLRTRAVNSLPGFLDS